MDIKEYTSASGRQFLKAENVTQNPTALWEIIDEAKLHISEKFGSQRLHIPVRMGEDEFTFDCSKTNAKFISLMLNNSDTKTWIGKMLVFDTYKTKTSDGKLVEALNVVKVN